LDANLHPCPIHRHQKHIGWEARANRVAVMLSNVDPDAMAYFRERVPEDALLIRLVPYRAVAAEGEGDS
jgi:hypothetical protein